ncbi:glucose-1-phosphate adenylyltransferase [Sphingobacterium spiritivorum]|uniref:Glucose-1-phosphate adenylyltransferase n=1 Tax=Sphingobacterium spiritivorum TaxID=258 RepID=A0A380BL31_SPHSI|nr:DUF4954 family protein [Sphingobacterium spiritivorum]SUJ02239.1 glucose-1-phosphate adenylyltransferase [Sphingobacterium spiritivorum]
MNKIQKGQLSNLGQQFIKAEYLVPGQDEYELRYEQLPRSERFRHLTQEQIETLRSNGNTADEWSNILVTDHFIPEQIRGCRFYGLNRIGDMEPIYLDYRELRLPTGIYHSTIVSCDIGNHVAIHEVSYMSYFIIADEVILSNIDEMQTSSKAKFGNGILRIGESPDVRVALELRNENGGRKVWPFDGMLLSDAYLWTRHRDDEVFQSKLEQMTNARHTSKRGTYSTIDTGTVIKNCQVIKDVRIGGQAYIKGVNKLKNVTIHSSETAPTQIGEGCELVNGIIGEGCRIFYGVKAVRFILAAHSQLKYGARLINSFLGENSTISCCEVLNSLIFPAHEQHHNNSFLCASLIMGQSNMAAGATVGSNHNSRSPDGEIAAGRGFWPGLCVSLKHNSRFASYTLIVKGDFLYEMDIRIPFSLVSNHTTEDRLIIVPGYWFLHNMYALARNPSKYEARDKRSEKKQYYEYDILAPDTVNELFESLQIMKTAVAKAYYSTEILADQEAILRGAEILESDVDISHLDILLDHFENSKRKVQLMKVRQGYKLFKKLIRYYGASALAAYSDQMEYTLQLLQQEVSWEREDWVNIGGQLIPTSRYKELIHQLKTDQLNSWDEVHAYYFAQSDQYQQDKTIHAVSALAELNNLKVSEITKEHLIVLFEEALEIKQWITEEIYQTRAKDYQNSFRMMVYESKEEMDKVVGALENNSFIRQQKEEFKYYHQRIADKIAQLKS